MPEWTLTIDSPPDTTRDADALEAFAISLTNHGDPLGPATSMNKTTGSVSAIFQVVADTRDDAVLRGLLAYWRAISDAGLELHADSHVQVARADGEEQPKAFTAAMQLERA